MEEIVSFLSTETFLFIIWMFLFWMWFRSETFGMSALIAVIFVPYNILFALYVVPEVVWTIRLIIILVSAIVAGYTVDMRDKAKK